MHRGTLMDPAKTRPNLYMVITRAGRRPPTASCLRRAKAPAYTCQGLARDAESREHWLQEQALALEVECHSVLFLLF